MSTNKYVLTSILVPTQVSLELQTYKDDLVAISICDRIHSCVLNGHAYYSATYIIFFSLDTREESCIFMNVLANCPCVATVKMSVVNLEEQFV